ncbi:MAG TPA: RNA polymerase sigma factor SigZ [Anaerolineae bacterium]
MDCSLEGVYEALHVDLRRFVLARIAEPAAADDVLQEIYLRVHTHIDSVRDCARLQAWVYQVARNAIVDHYRSRRPVAELPETLMSPEASCENDVECELIAALAPMIDDLPEKYRQALTLTLYEGITQREVAKRLGISLSGAKSRVQRAREQLKASLLRCCSFAFDRYGTVLDYWERRCCSATGLPP